MVTVPTYRQQVRPEEASRATYRNPVTPESRGAAVGRALSAAGDAGITLGNVFEARAALERDRQVEEGLLELDKRYTELAYDPDRGYMVQQGGNAVGAAFDSYTESLTGLRHDVASDMSPEVREEFLRRSAAVEGQAYRSGMVHQAEEQVTYTNETYAARAASETSQALRNWENEELFEEHLDAALGYTATIGRMNGAPAEKIENAQLELVSKAVRNRAALMADQNPMAAQEYLERNRERLTVSDYQEADAALEPIVRAYRADALVGAYTTGAGDPSTLEREAGVAPPGELSFVHEWQAENMDPRMMDILDRTSAAIGRGLTIQSGQRPRDYNARVGGAKNSQHITGTAADISTAGMTDDEKRELLTTLIENGASRFISYSNSDFIHVDIGNGVGGSLHFMHNGSQDYLASAPKWFRDYADELHGTPNTYFNSDESLGVRRTAVSEAVIGFLGSKVGDSLLRVEDGGQLASGFFRSIDQQERWERLKTEVAGIDETSTVAEVRRAIAASNGKYAPDEVAFDYQGALAAALRIADPRDRAAALQAIQARQQLVQTIQTERRREIMEQAKLNIIENGTLDLTMDEIEYIGADNYTLLTEYNTELTTGAVRDKREVVSALDDLLMRAENGVPEALKALKNPMVLLQHMKNLTPETYAQYEQQIGRLNAAQEGAQVQFTQQIETITQRPGAYAIPSESARETIEDEYNLLGLEFGKNDEELRERDLIQLRKEYERRLGGWLSNPENAARYVQNGNKVPWDAEKEIIDGLFMARGGKPLMGQDRASLDGAFISGLAGRAVNTEENMFGEKRPGPDAGVVWRETAETVDARDWAEYREMALELGLDPTNDETVSAIATVLEQDGMSAMLNLEEELDFSPSEIAELTTRLNLTEDQLSQAIEGYIRKWVSEGRPGGFDLRTFTDMFSYGPPRRSSRAMVRPATTPGRLDPLAGASAQTGPGGPGRIWYQRPEAPDEEDAAEIGEYLDDIADETDYDPYNPARNPRGTQP